jgi:uncharacterized membrane-anchored protein
MARNYFDGIGKAAASALRSLLIGACISLLASLATSPSAVAADPGATGSQNQTGEAARLDEARAAFELANKTGIAGPASVPLGDQAELRLPANMIYVHSAEAVRLLRALGNKPGDVNGMVIGTDRRLSWFVVVRFIADGYIRDDDAKNWNSDDLLTQLRKGTEAANKDRAERGFPQMEIVGWVEKPTYDAQTHRLVWSTANKDKGAPDSEERGVNYNTYALGRKGYFSLNLVTTSSQVEADKQFAKTLLGGLDYTPGNRYEDFNEATDHIAEYGLAGLLGIVAAKKLGLIALAGAFALKFAKVGLLALAGIGVAIRRFFKRGPKAEPEA